MNHGHVTPNPDGSKARCGGPAICSDCALEKARMTHAPTQLDASRWEEMARAINGQMDLWIQTEKQRGTWEANAPTVGQAYYASLVVAAFAQVAAEAREEAALAVETMPSTGFLAAKRIRALKSPKKESKP